MDKQTYIEQERLKIVQSWGSLVFLTGAAVTLLLSLLDYLVTPENFLRFFIYRIITASLVIVLYFLLKLKRDKFFQSIIITIASLLPTVMVELMILSFGGHQSIYYVGMIIMIMFILGFLPLFSIRMTLFLAVQTYAIYLLPILLLDDVTNMRVFINNNIFFISTVSIGLVWRHYNDSLLIKKLSLEYDLSQDKEQLAKYSNQLEHLVEERTRELNKSELMLRSLFDNANDGIMIMDRNGIIINVNQKACELHGFDRNALIGVNIGLLDAEENKTLFKERRDRILNGEALTFETRHYRKDGSKVSLEISSKAVEVEGQLLIQSFHRDITEKKRLQEQLLQSQKMESIGVLAGGIAHDFNNILSAILGHAQLLLEFGKLDEAVKQRIKIIENASRKAGQMVSKLLSFARQGNFECVPLNLNDVVKDTMELIERMMMKRKVEIKLELDKDLLSIEGDSNQMEQVVMNLVVNAADAMPDGGVLTIATGIAVLKDATPIHPLLPSGKYATLKISDTGAGIPDEIRGKIFDPFFTTKGVGKGTGLGLAMVYGIVKEHKGVVNVLSRVGGGTTFEIYLPVSGKAVPKIDRSYIYSIAGREKILVVDDEDDVLSFIKDTLDSQGYRVLVTNNPVYAQDIFREIHDSIDLVITDIVMPLVNGRELVRNLKSIKPSVKIIAITGYDILNTGEKDKDLDAYIRKPFESIYLLSIVRKVLDSVRFPTPSKQMPF